MRPGGGLNRTPFQDGTVALIAAPQHRAVVAEREAVLELINAGHTQTEVADIIAVSQPTVSDDLLELIDERSPISTALDARRQSGAFTVDVTLM
jgi:ParB-like chromosome segregation protein Spo0J